MSEEPKIIPITANELSRYGAETEDNVAFVIKLDKKRFLDLFFVANEWAFQLREEPTLKDEEVSIFTGRKVKYMNEITELYYWLMGKEMPVKR